MNGNLSVIYFTADRKTAGLIVVDLWADVAIVEVQVPSVHRRVSTYRPEVAIRALGHRRARRSTDGASIRKREWELWCNELSYVILVVVYMVESARRVNH